ncbi:MAG: hypothetical protein IJV65_02725 [Kiritimatiellae bacterium]|nr:hypothetical protein [Kiritimatiellia bacterium]
METISASNALRASLDRYGLQACCFHRNRDLPHGYSFNASRCPSQDIPFLLFVPPRPKRNLPLVLYLGGNGEHGTDLEKQFRQPTAFQIVTSPEFQKRHPCVLFAPMLPEGSVFRCAQSGWTSEPADLVCDAMYAAIRQLGPETVDTNRLYVTGLSYGGAAAFELCSQFPGRFAAAVPVAAFQFEQKIPTNAPGNYYLLYNESEYSSAYHQEGLDKLEKRVRGFGGDFRRGVYPATGHNAWDAAWREPSVWDWMFSKTADGRPVNETSVAGPRPVRSEPAPAETKPVGICSSSIPPRDERSGPDRAVDGLEGTAFVSSEPVGKGDWFQVEFDRPVKGTVCVESGNADGRGRLSSGRVEVSSDGKFWFRGGSFSRSSGNCRFEQRSPVRFLKVLPEPRSPEILTIREIAVE